MSRHIKGPVKYEPMGTMILDADNDRVCDIRGWGKFQYMEDGAEIQDSVGEFIADAINEKLTKCGMCHGSGFLLAPDDHASPCHICGGSGVIG